MAAPKKKTAKTVKTVKQAKKAAPKKTAKTPAKAAKKAPARKAAPRKKPVAKKATKQTTTTQPMETKMTKTANPFEQMAQEASKSGKAQSEACMRSLNVFMKGSEDLFKTNSAFFQKFAEKQMKYMNDSLKVTTLNEWAETQNEIAQENFNDLMELATKTSEQCVKLTTEALEPINEQINQAVKKATQKAA